MDFPAIDYLLNRLVKQFLFVLFCMLSTNISADAVRTSMKVIAMDYPPYTSPELPESGLAFTALGRVLADSQWQFTPEFLPPARAATELSDDQSWLLSAFPPPDIEKHIEIIELPGINIPFSLFRLHQPGKFQWDDLSELAGSTLIVTRTLKESTSIDKYRQAGLELLFVNDIEQGIKILRKGRADYLLSALDTVRYYSSKMGIREKEIQFAETIIRHYPYTFYLNHLHPQANQLRKDLIP